VVTGLVTPPDEAERAEKINANFPDFRNGGGHDSREAYLSGADWSPVSLLPISYSTKPLPSTFMG
jgi:hypothetical protein